MSAALQLSRARRQVLVIDSGRPRNLGARHAHGFIGHDGQPPADIADAARLPQGCFAVRCRSGGCWTGRYLVLAHGVVDELPQIDGLQERWGRSVFHCPYCHGYELQQGRIGALSCADDETGVQAVVLSDWGDVTLFCEPHDDAEVRERLAAAEVSVESTPIRRVLDIATVELEDGRRIKLDAIFVPPAGRLASPLAEQLGCELEDPGCISTDSAKQTTVEGVFACGDSARKSGNIALAVGEGALAGIAVHHALMQTL